MSKNLIRRDWDDFEEDQDDFDGIRKFRNEKSSDSKRYKKKDMRLRRQRKLKQKESFYDSE